MSLRRRRIFTVMIATIMSFIMSGMITAVNIGLPPHFLLSWLSAWSAALPMAIIATFIAQPLALRGSAVIERVLFKAEA